ncbi:fragilysin family metalloproteinase [Bacteroides fragilis]|uniref:Fragilysin family metalloproteinase n=1 Tax=Bacteroides fragilis TaxID=817 RepID=A0A396BV64_BACFG|nr:fragilysin family metalloproteinase [Bacteroides fragilis]RHH08651.1 fragilysin family metalloproteinase [Bacteroides fragilis]
MKKILFFKVLGLAALFTACSSEEGEMKILSNDSDVTNELNLQTLNYEHIASMLTDVPHSGKSIILNDGNTKTWEIKVSRDEKTTISGLDDAILYSGRSKDSTFLTLASDYATLRLTHNGQSINYVAYKDKDKMEEVARFYTKEFASTRALSNVNNVTYIYNESTRAANKDIACVVLNMGEIIEAYRSEYEDSSSDCIMPKISKKMNESSHIVTRTPAEPKSVYVVCLIEQGAQLLPNEVSWQMQDAAEALYDISDDYIKLDFKLLQSDFVATGDNADDKLESFRAKLLSIEELAPYDDQMFYLLHYGMWESGILGKAWLDTYRATNARGEFWASGLSAVTAIYPGVLAHEMGHNLGATHVADAEDLMRETAHTIRGYKHLDEYNRYTILRNITWEE